MSLYGFKADAPMRTLVGAALNKDEYNKFYEAATELFTDKYRSDLMMHLTDELFQGFSADVLIFEHSDEAQRTAFIDKYEILIGTRERAIDRNLDMVNYDAPDVWLDDTDTRTIAEIHNLTEETDKWDKRDDEEKEHDKKMKEMMDEMRKKGELSNDDSFSPKQNTKPKYNPDGTLIVEEVRTRVNADGSVDVDNILAHKYGEALSNAVLDVQMGDKNVRIDVNWREKNIRGADVAALRDDLWSSDKYKDQWAAGDTPKITITSRDGKQKSNVTFDEKQWGLFADAPYVLTHGEQMAEDAAKAQTTADNVLDKLNSVISNGPITGIEIVDPTTGAVQQRITHSQAGNGATNYSDYLFAFYRGEGLEQAGPGGSIFAIVSKAFFAQEGCLNDQHVSTQGGDPSCLYVPESIGEEMTESEFVSQHDEATVRSKLLALGLTESQDLDDVLNDD